MLAIAVEEWAPRRLPPSLTDHSSFRSRRPITRRINNMAKKKAHYEILPPEW